jgi:hypothetical protein
MGGDRREGGPGERGAEGGGESGAHGVISVRRGDAVTVGRRVASDTTAEQHPEPIPCTACRGTGKVISNLGGSPSTVDCPWCDGTGTYIPGHDAQSRHRGADQTASSGAPDSST